MFLEECYNHAQKTQHPSHGVFLRKDLFTFLTSAETFHFQCLSFHNLIFLTGVNTYSRFAGGVAPVIRPFPGVRTA